MANSTVRIANFLFLRAVLALSGSLLAFGQSSTPLDTCLEHISDEAAYFTQLAPQVIGREVMRQKALVLAPDAARTRDERERRQKPTKLLSHELVSEYGFVSLKAEPGNYHELRQLISVDDRPIATPEKAKKELLSGLKSLDDKRKRRLMEELTRHGLAEVAIDFGQTLMLFEKSHLKDFQFQVTGQAKLGEEEAVVIDFKQRQGTQRITVFGEGRVQHHLMTGRIWASKTDCTPLRVRLSASRTEDIFLIVDEGTTDYMRSAYGGLLPRTVTHRKLVNDKVITETVSEYSKFQKFTAETVIDFQPEPQPPPPQQ